MKASTSLFFLGIHFFLHSIHSLSNIKFGARAKQDEFPYAVRLVIKTDWLTSNLCTGSIISTRHILTAAHCVEKYKKIHAYVGSNVLKFSKKRVIDHAILHPSYKQNLTNAIDLYDIAILFVKEDLDIDESITPISLSAQMDIKDMINTSATIIGWGINQFRQSAKVLNSVTLEIESLDTCQKQIDNLNHEYGINKLKLDETIICTRPAFATGDDGDSGGPLIKKTKTREQHALIGLFIGNGGYGYPNVFVSVAAYRVFISRHVPEASWINPIPK